ncbi:hypothetical protein AB0G04_11575 [Actinoplanes sp. NPDC023801]|uniref:hypothetical protein n=1 Tax=Actinoplanes sp. NPDC023801 TaxID=3154595 RepID=UPI0033DB919B
MLANNRSGRSAGATAMFLLLSSLSPVMTMEPNRAAAQPAGTSDSHPGRGIHSAVAPHDEDPFPQQMRISFTLELHKDETRIDRVSFAATKQGPCSPDGPCGYHVPQDATVSMEYSDTFGCKGTASAPPFANATGTVSLGTRDGNGSYPLFFTVRLDYNTVLFQCADGTSGNDGANSSAGGSDENVVWTPGQQESIGVPVSNFLGASGHADIHYRY